MTPSNCLDIRNIKDIVDNYNNKDEHFLIRNQDDSTLHLKCDKMGEKEVWIEAINYMREFYANDKSSKIIFKDLDEETRIEILSENDLRFWSKNKVTNHFIDISIYNNHK